MMLRRVVTEALMGAFLVAFLALVALFAWGWAKGADAEPGGCPLKNQAIQDIRG